MTEEEFVGGDSTGCQYYSLHVILTMVLVRIPVHREKGTPFFTKEREQEREEERKREKKRLKTREKSPLLVSEANSRTYAFSALVSVQRSAYFSKRPAVYGYEIPYRTTTG